MPLKPAHRSASPRQEQRVSRPAQRRVGKSAKPAPKVGFVSLGCPKALVEFRAHHHQAASRGIRLSPATMRAPTWWWSTPAGSWTRRKAESLEAIGEAIEREWPASSSPAASVSRPDRIRAAHPERARRSPARSQYEAVVAAVHDAVPPAARALPRPRAAAGPEAHAAPLRLSEDLRGLQQPLLVLHHPAAARRSRQPPGGRRAAPRPSGW